MLYSEEDAPHLKRWIVKRLENTSDADADVLADYVLALLKHDGDENTVRALCESEIPDFLKEDSSLFVSDVFEAIHYKSYIPGAPPPPPKTATTAIAPAFLPPAGPSAMFSGAIGDLNGIQNGSRKRSYHEQAGNDMSDAGNSQYGMRNFKQPRRGGNFGRGGRFDNFDNNRGARSYQHSPALHQPIPGFNAAPNMQNSLPPLPPLDTNDPMAALVMVQQIQQALSGGQVPGMPPNLFPPLPSPAGQGANFRSSNNSRPYGQKPRCRDYDMKGYCARGTACHFDHGSESVFVPPPSDEYDPSNSSLLPGLQSSPTNGSPSLALSPFGTGNRGFDSGRGRGGFQRGDRGGQRGNPSRRGGRAEFSSDRPNYDRSNTTIVVENIPEEKFSEEQVREFFGAFGSIAEVSMRPYKRLAVVKYEDWNSAQAAYNSPHVIFDNRFVKVYWYNPEKLPQPPAVAGTSGVATGNAKNGSANATPVPARSDSAVSIDMEEFAAKQQEAQRIQEEKAKKRLENEAALKEMKAKQEALLKSHEEEKKKLMEKLAAKTGKPVKSEDDSNSEVERLKAVLASKKAEWDGGSEWESGEESYGWSGRGRGRGGYRGRGTYMPRGGYRGYDRGGYRGRGRGGAPFVIGGGAYNLDNRPKKIYLSGIDFTDSEKNERLREYLLGYETTEIETNADKSYITFTDRKTAEKFKASCIEGNIPDVGTVEIGWVPNTSMPAKSTVQTQVTVKQEDDTVMGEGDAMAQDEASRGAGQQHVAEQAQEVDYDVADDNDWAE